MAQNYQPGVAHEIDINQFQSVVEVFDRSVKKFHDRPALACMGKELSYSEMDQLSGRFASFLQHKLGLKRATAWR